MTFTQKVNRIAEALELTTKKAIAEALGVNASTLGSALKTDAEGEYTGALTEPVDAKLAELEDNTTERAAPRGKLNDLRKVGTCDWRAEINGAEVVIQKNDAGVWSGGCDLPDGDSVYHEAGTFKDIIGALRESTAKVAA